MVGTTPIGRIALLICYDDTYWQYARLAALRGADIIGWHSVSDRVMTLLPDWREFIELLNSNAVEYVIVDRGAA